MVSRRRRGPLEACSLAAVIVSLSGDALGGPSEVRWGSDGFHPAQGHNLLPLNLIERYPRGGDPETGQGVFTLELPVSLCASAPAPADVYPDNDVGVLQSYNSSCTMCSWGWPVWMSLCLFRPVLAAGVCRFDRHCDCSRRHTSRPLRLMQRSAQCGPLLARM
jgi:hypothetical protein